jgi:hemoglobin-like flavoprotein
MKNFEEIFNDSFERVLSLDKDNDLFFSKFYNTFLAASPIVKQKFQNTDMTNQKLMLKKSFYQMLNFFVNKIATDYMTKIADLHSKKDRDISPELYDLWLESLVSTVKELDPKYNHDVGLAWKMIMGIGITYMKDYYNRDE